MEVLIAFRWPLCVFFLAMFGLLLFKKEFKGLVGRIRRVSRAGLEADPVPGAAQEARPITDLSPADQLLRAFDNRLLVEQEASIVKDLEHRNIVDPAERQRILLRFLAAFQVVAIFEQIYRLIYGSQLRALHALNEREPQGVPLKFLERYYEFGAIDAPEVYAAYPFDRWFGFLEGRTLVLQREGMAHITVLGREFLKYLVDAGYSLDKPL